jgi:uncharacterized membrane-anchored protein
MVIEGACVTVAMYCLIQFYIQLKDDLAEHNPLLKVLAIKLVIFLSFWQTVSSSSSPNLPRLIFNADHHLVPHVFRRHQA